MSPFHGEGRGFESRPEYQYLLGSKRDFALVQNGNQPNGIRTRRFKANFKAIFSQGEDVSEKATKLYIAYKRTRNFASIFAKKDELLLFLHVNPDSVEMKERMCDDRCFGEFREFLECVIFKLDRLLEATRCGFFSNAVVTDETSPRLSEVVFLPIGVSVSVTNAVMGKA